MATATDETQQSAFIELGAIGTGAIQAGVSQQARLEEFTARVGGGEFHRPTAVTLPCTCIDGRFGASGELVPNAAGGSESLMVADDLTTKRYAQADDGSTCGQFRAMLADLKAAERAVGGHTAADCHGAPSGCGANDKLPAIYAYVAANGDTLREVAISLLAYEIDDETHGLIVKNAAERTEFSGGDELLSALQENDGRVDVLEGEHTEVLAVINRRPGTTLDRDAVRAAFGDEYEAFNVDEWAFLEGAKAVSEPGYDAEAHKKRVAMFYYNLATAGVLCGPGMRVTVLA